VALSFRRVLSGLRPFRALARIEQKLDEERLLIKALQQRLEQQAGAIKALRSTQPRPDAPGPEKAHDVLRRELVDLRHAVERTHRDVARLSTRLDRQTKQHASWQTGASWQLNALIRRLFLPSDVPFPFNLAARRFKLRSQHEEDGYLLAILDEIGTTNRRFVEIGCGRSGGNAAVLAFELGWSGLMIDANPAAIEYVSTIYAFNETVRSVQAEVTAENINPLLAAHGCAGEVDLLSIDIDSYDYWVFEALDVCSPRLLMLEYNAGFGPTARITLPKQAPLADAPKGYFGASLAALTALAARKGYRLVACEYSGVNAFYLREDVAPAIPGQPVERAYRPQMSRHELEVERAGPETVMRRIAERGLPLEYV
jgi:hypothetical protein